MKSEELINCFGYSIKSKQLVGLMNDFGIDQNPKDKLDVNGDKYDVSSGNNERSIVLTFYGYNRYTSQFGAPNGVSNPDADELILMEIDFTDKLENSKLTQLPFGLNFLDSKEDVYSKLKKKPKDKSSTSYGSANWFEKDEYRIIVALNQEDKLIWLRLLKHSKWELEKIQLRKDLAKQKKNINPQNEDLVSSFKDNLPTKRWEQSMKEGDDLFTKKAITEIESILLDYIESLSNFTRLKKASNIFNSVKKVVKKINKVNDRNDYFIETLEREELCEFIDNIVLATGFKINEGIDLTEEWREW